VPRPAICVNQRRREQTEKHELITFESTVPLLESRMNQQRVDAGFMECVVNRRAHAADRAMAAFGRRDLAAVDSLTNALSRDPVSASRNVTLHHRRLSFRGGAAIETGANPISADASRFSFVDRPRSLEDRPVASAISSRGRRVDPTAGGVL